MSIATPTLRALILFAHGSRDAAWKQPFEAIACQIRARAPFLAVELAFLELCEPSLPTVIQTLTEQGCVHIEVMPAFLGRGKHLTQDLTALLHAARERYPDINFVEHPAWGESENIQTALANACLAELTD